VAEKRRHSHAEIAAKLAQAEIMSQEGRTQGDIARSLEVSVMTFHRWRKAHPQRAAMPSSRTQEAASGRDHRERIAELQLENSRLRRLVTDLLLEKLKLEEEAGGRSNESDESASLVPRLRVGSD
jgi:pyrroloquinoline quinone (PQQ) biosynthesis protein C